MKLINIAITPEVREKIQNLKQHKNQSCNDLVETAIHNLINERDSIEKSKNFKDFRIIKGRENIFYCSLCGNHKCLLCEGHVSREKLNLEPVSDKLYFCERCLLKAKERFENPTEIERT